MLSQAVWVGLRTPRLPDAGGPTSGVVAGAAPALRVVVLGESTVAGIGAPTHEGALSGRVAHALAQRTGRFVAWEALGRSGATVRTALEELVPRLDGTADLLVLALGVNDVLRVRTATQWASDLAALLAAARARLGDPVVVVAGMPPMGAFPAFPQPLRLVLGLRARALDDATRLVVAAAPRTVSVHAGIGADPAWFCDDRFHPSPAGYARWADVLADAAEPLLRRTA